MAGFDHAGWEATDSTDALSVVLLATCITRVEHGTANARVSHEQLVLEGLFFDINGQVVLLVTRKTRNCD